MEIEAVDVVLAHQHRQGFGDGLHGHAHFARLGAVDGDMRLLAVEGQVVLHVDEQAAGIGRRLDLLGGVIERLEVLRRAQHHLHRQAAAGARQRRELHGGQRFAVDRAAGRLYLALDLMDERERSDQSFRIAPLSIWFCPRPVPPICMKLLSNSGMDSKICSTRAA